MAHSTSSNCFFFLHVRRDLQVLSDYGEAEQQRCGKVTWGFPHLVPEDKNTQKTIQNIPTEIRNGLLHVTFYLQRLLNAHLIEFELKTEHVAECQRLTHV